MTYGLIPARQALPFVLSPCSCPFGLNAGGVVREQKIVAAGSRQLLWSAPIRRRAARPRTTQLPAGGSQHARRSTEAQLLFVDHRPTKRRAALRAVPRLAPPAQ
ncbi:hypothetical protein [Massilia sp. GCM10023247]|uniref:hypothetical protein n=1 Tax=Massilia sp. GCM10023247 TaxID=3252643 RepID=UPI00360F162F